MLICIGFTATLTTVNMVGTDFKGSLMCQPYIKDIVNSLTLEMTVVRSYSHARTPICCCKELWYTLIGKLS